LVYDDNEAVLDDGLVLFFEQGASFTGDDVVELQLHGGRYLLHRVLDVLVRTGLCRVALPGEFSFRAVRSGRMGLDQASAVQQLIHSQSSFELWSARQNLSGSRAQFFSQILQEIRAILARVELSIDFIEQDVEVYGASQAQADIGAVVAKLERLKHELTLSRRVADGPLVVFYGKPNVGKSTLFNSILGEERAIVSSIPGTTRDVITERLEVGPYAVKLADTAGIRQSDDVIESDGVRRTMDLLIKADVRVLMLSASENPFGDIASAVQLGEAPNIVIVNKSDLVEKIVLDEIASECRLRFGVVPVVFASLIAGEGTDRLLICLRQALDAVFGKSFQQPLPTLVQVQSLDTALQELREAQSVLLASAMDQPEVLSSILFRACRGLALLCGETDPDTVLNKIFSEFCIGK
jgi:tRNA modification GTPase